MQSMPLTLPLFLLDKHPLIYYNLFIYKKMKKLEDEMKKEIFLYVVMIILGLFLGYSVMNIVMAVATPNYNNMILTTQEYNDFEKMGGIVEKAKTSLWINLILAIIAFILLIQNLNPNLWKALTDKKTFLKAISVLVFPVILFFIILEILKQSDLLCSTNLVIKFAPNISFIIFFGLIWLIIGEMGWGGDFKSWGFGTEKEKGKPLVSFILGALVGFTISCFFYLNFWAFNSYLILVTEVLDKSGEVSYLGFIYLRNASVFLFGLTFTIFAGLFTACAPVYRKGSGSFYRLILPVILIVILSFTIKGVYNEAVAKYDWGKINLASIINVPSIATENKTVVFLKEFPVYNKEKGKKREQIGQQIKILRWALEAEGFGILTGNSKIELSYENLKKVEKFITEREDGSIFRYAAFDILYNGYYRLWDVEKGLEKQYNASYHMFMPRVFLLNQLQDLPITEKNLRYLREFSDGKHFVIGGRSAFVVSKAYVHFGQFAEAEKWLIRTKSGEIQHYLKEELQEYKIPEKVLLDGKISGTISINQTPASNIKIALFKDRDEFLDFKGLMLPRNLLDSRIIKEDGKFEFTNLGSGDYMLAIMTDKNLINFNINPENLKFANLPGTINLTLENGTVDLGMIELETVK